MDKREPYCILDNYSGSPSNMMKKAHQQSDLKTLIRTRSNFLMCVHSSAIADSPNLRVIPFSFAIKSQAPRTRLFGDNYNLTQTWIGDHRVSLFLIWIIKKSVFWES